MKNIELQSSRQEATRPADRRAVRVTLCIVAFVVTVMLAGYQRRTGPTYPVTVRAEVAGVPVSGELVRSHGGEGGAVVVLHAPDPRARGEILWRLYPTDHPWQRIEMARQGEDLLAELPHLPPAGKLEYSVRIRVGDEELVLPPGGKTAVLRYKGAVPAFILVPHILCMFIALVISVRAGLGAIAGESNTGRFVKWVLLFFVPGGFVLGPLVQKYAFGALWTGWPYGTDWTDNKTLFALLAWILAGVLVKFAPRAERVGVLFAFAMMIAVYLVPHSFRGSEIDWSRTAPPPHVAVPGEPAAPAGEEGGPAAGPGSAGEQEAPAGTEGAAATSG